MTTPSGCQCPCHDPSGMKVAHLRACCWNPDAPQARNDVAFADHPHSNPGDGRTECQTCGKWAWLVTHSCKGVPVTEAALRRFRDGEAS